MASSQFRLEPIVPKRPISKANKGKVLGALRDFGADMVNRMGEYPAARTSYRRTGNLGKSWTFDGPKARGGDIVVEVGTNIGYGSFVQGLKSQDPKQRQLFAGYGWESVETAAIDELKKHRPEIEKALQE